jgi:hypothetical protein
MTVKTVVPRAEKTLFAVRILSVPLFYRIFRLNRCPGCRGHGAGCQSPLKCQPAGGFFRAEGLVKVPPVFCSHSLFFMQFY